jgi:tetratricopeptide (TPR) repeat protein
MNANTLWSPLRIGLVALAVALFAWLVHMPALENGFVSDDVILIGNPDITTLDAAAVKRIFTTHFWDASDATSGLYRPLTTLSFYTDYRLYANHANGFHDTNIILDALASATVFVLLLEIFSQPVLALLAALWFAAFPMHVESVAWISGRTDILATLLGLISLWCYVRWRRRGTPLAALASLLFYALALLAKEVAVVVPGVAAAYELLPHAASARAKRGIGRWGVFCAMLACTAAYFVLRRAVIGSSMWSFPRLTHGFVQAVALPFSIVAHYAYKLVYPFRLNPNSEYSPPTTFFNLHTLVGIVVAMLTVWAVVRWRRNPVFVFAVAVMVCGLAPVLHIVPANQVLAERFLYFPSIGFALLVSWLVTHFLSRHRRLVLSTYALVLLAFCARTVTGTQVWKSDIALYTRAVELAPQNPRAHFDLGVTLGEMGRLDEALAQFHRATELDANYAPAWSAMGRTEDMLGHPAQGLEHCARAVALAPDDPLFNNDLGTMQFRAHDWAGAAQSFRRVVELRPRQWHARFNLGLALYQQHDLDGAIRELSAVADKDPQFVNAWFFIAEAETLRGNRDAAVRAATKFLSLHSTDDAMASRARAIVSEGQNR